MVFLVQLAHMLQIQTCLLPRTALLIYVICALGGVWVLEQPSTSQLRWHPRIRALFRHIHKAGHWGLSVGPIKESSETIPKEICHMTV